MRILLELGSRDASQRGQGHDDSANKGEVRAATGAKDSTVQGQSHPTSMAVPCREKRRERDKHKRTVRAERGC